MLVLTCVPCNDTDELVFDTGTLITQQTNSSHHEHTDMCSPFCACACCHVSSLEPPQSSYSAEVGVNEDKDIPSLENFFIQDCDINIWQPPKI